MAESVDQDMGMEGSLMKRSDTLKQWRRRWFRLRPYSVHLEYRKAADNTTAHFLIGLRNVCVGPLPSPSKHREWFCFYVQGPTFTYWLAADSLDTASCWMDRINAAASRATAAALAWASHTPSIDGRSVYASIDGRSSGGDFCLSPRSLTEVSPGVESNVEEPLAKDRNAEAPFNLSRGFFPWPDDMGTNRTGSTEVAPSVHEEDWEERFTPIGSPSSAHFSASSVLRSTAPSSASSLARIDLTHQVPRLRAVPGMVAADINNYSTNDSSSRWSQIGRWWRTGSLSHVPNGESVPPWSNQYEQMAALLMEMRASLEAKEKQLDVVQQAAAIDARQLASANLRAEEIASKGQEEIQALQNSFEIQSQRCAEEKVELTQQLEKARSDIEALRKQLLEESEKSTKLQSRVDDLGTELVQHGNRATRAETEFARLYSVEDRCLKLETEAADLKKKLDTKEDVLLRPFWGN